MTFDTIIRIIMTLILCGLVTWAFQPIQAIKDLKDK